MKPSNFSDFTAFFSAPAEIHLFVQARNLKSPFVNKMQASIYAYYKD